MDIVCPLDVDLTRFVILLEDFDGRLSIAIDVDNLRIGRELRSIVHRSDRNRQSYDIAHRIIANGGIGVAVIRWRDIKDHRTVAIFRQRELQLSVGIDRRRNSEGIRHVAGNDGQVIRHRLASFVNRGIGTGFDDRPRLIVGGRILKDHDRGFDRFGPGRRDDRLVIDGRDRNRSCGDFELGTQTWAAERPVEVADRAVIVDRECERIEQFRQATLRVLSVVVIAGEVGQVDQRSAHKVRHDLLALQRHKGVGSVGSQRRRRRIGSQHCRVVVDAGDREDLVDFIKRSGNGRIEISGRRVIRGIGQHPREQLRSRKGQSRGIVFQHRACDIIQHRHIVDRRHRHGRRGDHRAANGQRETINDRLARHPIDERIIAVVLGVRFIDERARDRVEIETGCKRRTGDQFVSQAGRNDRRADRNDGCRQLEVRNRVVFDQRMPRVLRDRQIDVGHAKLIVLHFAFDGETGRL